MSAENKAEIVNGIRVSLPHCIVVAVSGIAGIGDSSLLKIRKISDNFYVIGDMATDADTGNGLIASRVGIAASMQAHLIIRLIMEKQP